MKKLNAITTSLLAAMFLFSACQPTPEKPIVNAGDGTELNDKIDATAIPTPESKDETLSSIYNFPTSHKDEFTGVDTDVKFNVDAEVIVPNVQSVPVVEVEPSGISAEMVKNFTEKMLPGVIFYDRKKIYTKEEILKKIEILQPLATVSFDEFCETYDGYNDEENARYLYQMAQYAYGKYKEMLPNAPETEEQEPFDFEFHDLLGYYAGGMPEMDYADSVYGDVYSSTNKDRQFMWMSATFDDSGDTYDITLDVETHTGDDVTGTFKYRLGFAPLGQTYGNDPVINVTEARELTLSETELKALGEKVLDCMGLLDDMVLTSMMLGAKRCELTYHRGFNGLEGSDVFLENDYAYVNGNEYVKVTIQNDLVTAIDYENPYVVSNTENENVELISFEEAYAAFKKQAAVEYITTYSNGETEDENGNIVPDERKMKSYNISVDTIELVMVRIPIKNGGYRYVPAWQFRGSDEIDYGDHVGKADDLTFMTINAVDGTRIAGLQATSLDSIW